MIRFKSLCLFFVIFCCPLLANDAFVFNRPQSAPLILSLKEETLIHHVQRSIENAEKHLSKLTPEILQIHGMSSYKVRHLLNNLCSLPNTTYFEIGTWKGSTFIAATYGNEQNLIDAVAVDNWSEFDGPKEDFIQNCETFIPSLRYRCYFESSFNLNPYTLFSTPVTTYLYDGCHDEEAHVQAFTHFNASLDNTCIVMVDDWNWDRVRRGTFWSFRHLGYEVLFERALHSASNGDMNEWWNGFYIAVIRKK